MSVTYPGFLLGQVITAAEFHPTHCSLFAFSSSKGCIRLADMRESALCDKYAKAFEATESQVCLSPVFQLLALPFCMLYHGMSF
jgi:serine/threonine-protein phosphatase 2A regulatory subunit B